LGASAVEGQSLKAIELPFPAREGERRVIASMPSGKPIEAVSLTTELPSFLTLPAYDRLLEQCDQLHTWH
jgi:hypothetical protein